MMETGALARVHRVSKAIRAAAANAEDPDSDRSLARAIQASRTLALNSASLLGIADDLSQNAIDTSFLEEHGLAYAWRKLTPEQRDASTRNSFANLTTRLLDNLGIPMTWVSRGPLGQAWRQSVGSTRLQRAFTDALLTAAGISTTSAIDGSPDSIFTETRMGQFLNTASRPGAHWDYSAAGSRLIEISTPLITGARPADDLQAAAVRTMALALAVDSPGKYSTTTDEIGDLSVTHFPEKHRAAIGAFRELAATITVLQQRERGQAPSGEAIVLALA